MLLRLLLACCEVYSWLIIARVIIGWLNPTPRHEILVMVCRVTDPLLDLLRPLIPLRGLDLSPDPGPAAGASGLRPADQAPGRLAAARRRAPGVRGDSPSPGSRPHARFPRFQTAGGGAARPANLRAEQPGGRN